MLIPRLIDVGKKVIKNKIVNMIEECDGGVPFVELMKIPGFEVDDAIGSPEYNDPFWVGISAEAVAALHDLVVEDIVVMTPTTVAPCLIDGVTLQLPLDKKGMKYRNTRWLPMLLDKGPRFRLYFECEGKNVSSW
jgi:hypothetical protein